MLYVRKIGVELEGGWDSRPPDSVASALKRDGSVTCTGAFYVGEIASPPLTSWPAVAKWMSDAYPHHINSSCGLHVHMSFGDDKRNYQSMLRLADDKAYQDFLLASLLKWAQKRSLKYQRLQDRVEGKNRFCQVDWRPQGLHNQGADRYSAVNFTAYGKHRTVEIRVLPMFTSSVIAVEAVRRVVAATEVHLRKMWRAPYEFEFVTNVKLPQLAGA